jgi:hypothetical protein
MKLFKKSTTALVPVVLLAMIMAAPTVRAEDPVDEGPAVEQPTDESGDPAQPVDGEDVVNDGPTDYDPQIAESGVPATPDRIRTFNDGGTPATARTLSQAGNNQDRIHVRSKKSLFGKNSPLRDWLKSQSKD